jgi:hypothetical protein
MSLTDFKAKMNKSKINNNNKTNTKHEFNVKYERYKQDISKDTLQMQIKVPNYQMTAFVFFIFKSAGEGEGWFEGDST